MMVQVVSLSDLPITSDVAEAFIVEREAQSGTYHQVYAPSAERGCVNSDYAVWLAADRVAPSAERYNGARYILVHVTY